MRATKQQSTVLDAWCAIMDWISVIRDFAKDLDDQVDAETRNKRQRSSAAVKRERFSEMAERLMEGAIIKSALVVKESVEMLARRLIDESGKPLQESYSDMADRLVGEIQAVDEVQTDRLVQEVHQADRLVEEGQAEEKTGLSAVKKGNKRRCQQQEEEEDDDDQYKRRREQQEEKTGLAAVDDDNSSSSSSEEEGDDDQYIRRRKQQKETIRNVTERMCINLFTNLSKDLSTEDGKKRSDITIPLALMTMNNVVKEIEKRIPSN